MQFPTFLLLALIWRALVIALPMPGHNVGDVVHVHPHALGLPHNGQHHPAIVVDKHASDFYSIAHISHGLPAHAPKAPTSNYHHGLGGGGRPGQPSMIHVGPPKAVTGSHLTADPHGHKRTDYKSLQSLRGDIKHSMHPKHNWESHY
ncbi:hypothetical protein AX15_004878 [Amanita polypyramis BW_CC]|nr:hypothetical protein AX15_004878 [Amanita polypyramis BW_CC]